MNPLLLSAALLTGAPTVVFYGAPPADVPLSPVADFHRVGDPFPPPWRPASEWRLDPRDGRYELYGAVYPDGVFWWTCRRPRGYVPFPTPTPPRAGPGVAPPPGCGPGGCRLP